MLLKANHDLVLPNGKKVKAGQEFDYSGDLKPIEAVVVMISKKIKATPVKHGNKAANKTPEKEPEENVTEEDPKGKSDEAEENQNTGGVPEKG